MVEAGLAPACSAYFPGGSYPILLTSTHPAVKLAEATTKAGLIVRFVCRYQLWLSTS